MSSIPPLYKRIHNHNFQVNTAGPAVDEEKINESELHEKSIV